MRLYGQELEHRRDLRQGSGRFIFFCRSFRSLNLGGKGSRVWRACNAARAWPVRCRALCGSPSEPSELLVRKVKVLLVAGYLRAAPLQALPRCWLGSRRAPRTLQRQRQYRVAGWRGPGSGLTWFSCRPPRSRDLFPPLRSQSTPPPSPLVFFSVFFQTQKHVFLVFFEALYCF